MLFQNSADRCMHLTQGAFRAGRGLRDLREMRPGDMKQLAQQHTVAYGQADTRIRFLRFQPGSFLFPMLRKPVNLPKHCELSTALPVRAAVVRRVCTVLEQILWLQERMGTACVWGLAFGNHCGNDETLVMKSGLPFSLAPN